MPAPTDTYIIADPDDVWGHGPCRGTITDALTGVETACFRGGARVPLGVDLCVGCDLPVAAGPCDCEKPATPNEAREARRVAVSSTEMAA